MSSLEKYFIIGIFSDNSEIASNLGTYFGKSDQYSDLKFYDQLDEQNNLVFCAIQPISYPDKIKSLIQALVLSNYHIIIIDNDKGLNSVTGEILIAVDTFYNYIKNKNSFPIILISNITPANEYKLDENVKKLKTILNTTSISNSPIFIIKENEDRDLLRKYIINAISSFQNYSYKKEDAIVLIDSAFPVKGIGTVILGIVQNGTIEVGDMLNLIGLNKKTIIKSIQKQDRDFKTAIAGERVGISIKGVKPEEIDRNYVLAASDLYEIKNSFKINLYISPYFGNLNEISENRQFTIFINLSQTPIKIKNIDKEKIKQKVQKDVEVECVNPIPIPIKNPKGIIVELNKFANKSRILGHCEIILK